MCVVQYMAKAMSEAFIPMPLPMNQQTKGVNGPPLPNPLLQRRRGEPTAGPGSVAQVTGPACSVLLTERVLAEDGFSYRQGAPNGAFHWPDSSGNSEEPLCCNLRPRRARPACARLSPHKRKSGCWTGWRKRAAYLDLQANLYLHLPIDSAAQVCYKPSQLRNKGRKT
jgi:hypothetical protein